MIIQLRFVSQGVNGGSGVCAEIVRLEDASIHPIGSTVVCRPARVVVTEIETLQEIHDRP